MNDSLDGGSSPYATNLPVNMCTDSRTPRRFGNCSRRTATFGENISAGPD